MGLSPGIAVLLGVLILIYGLLIGGTWANRHGEKLWDTVSTIAMLVIAAVATGHLVYVGARQTAAFEKARDRLECVASDIDALRNQLPLPDCVIHWDE